jgi:hypothetical protein
MNDPLEDFAVSLRSKSVWTPDIQQQLMDLIRGPAMIYRGQIIPPNDRTKALDNLFRCKPTAWDIGMESIGFSCQARLRLWYQSLNDTAVRLHVEVTSGDIVLRSNALALTAALARTWALIVRAGVMHDFEIPDNPPYSTY